MQSGHILAVFKANLLYKQYFIASIVYQFETLVDTTSRYVSAGVTSLAEVSLSGPGVLEAAHQPWYELTCSWQHSAEEMAELDIKVSPCSICSTQHCSTYSLLQWYFGPGDSPFLQWVPGSGTQPQSVDTRAGAGDNLFRSRIQVRTRVLVHVLCDVTRGLVHVL